MSLNFPLPKIRTFRFSLDTSCLSLPEGGGGVSCLNEQVLSCWVVMIIPFPLPQHQHTLFQRRRLNPGRNVVSDKKCAGAEGEEMVLAFHFVFKRRYRYTERSHMLGERHKWMFLSDLRFFML